MFGLGFTEILVILVLVLILFGAGKLPSVMGDLGRGLKSFKDEMDGKGSSGGKPKAKAEMKALPKKSGLKPVKKTKKKPAAKKRRK